MPSRYNRARNQTIELTFVDGDRLAVKSDGSEESHVLETDGIEAVSCTCPDYEHREPEGGCKHMIAWEKWFIDVVRFSDGYIAWKSQS